MKILDQDRGLCRLRFKEALYIMKLNPSLNVTQEDLILPTNIRRQLPKRNEAQTAAAGIPVRAQPPPPPAAQERSRGRGSQSAPRNSAAGHSQSSARSHNSSVDKIFPHPSPCGYSTANRNSGFPLTHDHCDPTGAT